MKRVLMIFLSAAFVLSASVVLVADIDRVHAESTGGNTMNIADEAFLEGLEDTADEMKESVLEAASEYTVGDGGRVFYISADGDDSNNGRSPEAPKKTISSGLGSLFLQPGDVVLFRRGDTFRGKLNARNGVTYSAYGTGAKPIINGSEKNYADASCWVSTEYTNVWKCTETLKNVGMILFDYSGEIGNYDELLAAKRIVGVDGFTGAADLSADLEFYSDLGTKELFLYSKENPGTRFDTIDVGTSGNIIGVGTNTGITVDNLHLMVTGGHGVGANTTSNLTVRNCVFDWIGGSVLEGYGGADTTRYGNAVEVYGGVNGYKVYNNWIYQIYDTGITHQFSGSPTTSSNVMNNVGYWNNLVEYCFWSIEYYNHKSPGGTSTTTNVYVHDNFCRFGGFGWGCKGRERSAPMYSVSSTPTLTNNYVTENNIFDRCAGHLISSFGQTLGSEYTFTGNTYVQYFGASLGWLSGSLHYFNESAPQALKECLGENDAKLYYIDNTSDLIGDDLDVTHSISGGTWDGNDTSAHKASTTTPTIDYKLSFDLSSLELTFAGISHVGGMPVPADRMFWNFIKTSDVSNLRDSALYLYISFDDKIAPDVDFSEISLEHEWFELDTDDFEHPERAVVMLGNNTFLIKCRVGTGEYAPAARGAVSGTPSDELTVTGINASLKTPLTDADTNVSPREIKATGFASGEINVGSYCSLAFANEKSTNLAKIYYKDITYTVTFDPNGGTVAPERMTTGNDRKLASLPQAKRDGYTFDGWFTERTGGDKISVDRVYSSDATVYAHWSSGGSNTLKFETNGGGGIETITGNRGDKINLNDYRPGREGYNFTGWYSDKNLTNKLTEITLDGDSVVYAGWTEKVTSPQTADTSNIAPFAAALALGGMVLCAETYARKKRASGR